MSWIYRAVENSFKDSCIGIDWNVQRAIREDNVLLDATPSISTIARRGWITRSGMR